jgi:nucleoside-diphosphate-sugar epimerase
VTFADAARCIKAALQVDLRSLPSRNEVFFVTSDLPHGRYSNAKARRLLGWEPLDLFTGYFTKQISSAKKTKTTPQALRKGRLMNTCLEKESVTVYLQQPIA